MSAIMDTAISAPIPATSLPALAISHPAVESRPSVIINSDIVIPTWVVDHASYRRWAHSDEFPERGRFSYIDGTIWVELAMEEFLSHNLVKTEYTRVLANVVDETDAGYFGSDGNLWTHADAGISTEADGIFINYATLQSGRVRLLKGVKRGYMEIEGSPNMALEIVSDGSVQKDFVIMKDKCAKAGVDEYWLVDAREADVHFEIWRLQDGQYVAAKADDGWLESVSFGRSFKLEQRTDRLGHARLRLIVR